MKYVTYITIYTGSKLPPFYIGSSSLEKVKNGYFGSVKSIQYRDTWKEERRNNSKLFKIKILSYHETRKEALEKELYFQKSLNVVHNSLYINKAFACKNGCFGVSNFKENHPNYNKRNLECGWYGKKRSEESKQRYSKSKMGDKNPYASIFRIYDKNDTLLYEFKSNFVDECKNLNIPLNIINKLVKSYKNKGEKLENKKKITKTGPKPILIDEKYIGWYVLKICINKCQKNNEKVFIGRKWWYNPQMKIQKFSKECPGEGYINQKVNTKKR